MFSKKKMDLLVATLFRVLFSLIFFGAGMKHVFFPQKIVDRLAESSSAEFLAAIVPLSFLVVLTGVVLLVGGVSLLLGFWTKRAALVLILVLIPITLSVQTAGGESMGPLFKNIALLGALIHFAWFGTSGWSLDRHFGRS